MIAVLVLLLVALAPAQPSEDARALLEEVASASRAAKSWFAEGTRVGDLRVPGMEPLHSESRFKVAYQSPSKMLVENDTTKDSVGGVDPGYRPGTVRVCDGTDSWISNSPGHSFYHSRLTGQDCRPEIADFSKITEHLVSAEFTGRDRLQVGGAAKECQLVRAEYAFPVAPMPSANRPAMAHSVVQRFCIDPVQKLILRDRAERQTPAGVTSVDTTTYTTLERDTDLPADLFRFQVPTGYFEDPEGSTLEMSSGRVTGVLLR